MKKLSKSEPDSNHEVEVFQSSVLTREDFAITVFMSVLVALMGILVGMVSFGVTFSANQDKVIDARVEMLTDYGYENVAPFEDVNSKHRIPTMR